MPGKKLTPYLPWAYCRTNAVLNASMVLKAVQIKYVLPNTAFIKFIQMKLIHVHINDIYAKFCDHTYLIYINMLEITWIGGFLLQNEITCD